MPMKQFHICLCHYTKLTNRLPSLLLDLFKHGLKDIHIIGEGDQEDLKDNYANFRNQPNPESRWDQKAKIAGYGEVPFKWLRPSDFSLIWKHFEAFRQISASGKKYGIVLEDDCVLHDNFVADVNKLIQYDGWDWVYGGSEFNNRFGRKLIADGLVSLQNNPTSNCTDCYVITKETCDRILKVSDPIRSNLTVDFEMSYLAGDLNLNVGHFVNPIVHQNREYDSSLKW